MTTVAPSPSSIPLPPPPHPPSAALRSTSSSSSKPAPAPQLTELPPPPVPTVRRDSDGKPGVTLNVVEPTPVVETTEVKKEDVAPQTDPPSLLIIMAMVTTADPALSYSLYISPSNLITPNGASSLPAFPIDALNIHPAPSRPASPIALPYDSIFDFDLFLNHCHRSDDRRDINAARSPSNHSAPASSSARPLSPSANPQRPPIRPGPTQRSNFALEPNPFEQSFSRSSHNSQSDVSEQTTPPRGGDATSLKHNPLPPLSSLTSPAAADPSQFPWLANHSLRTGPLSPAMLPGPQHGNGHHAHNPSALRHADQGEQNANHEGGFDSNTFRTGFTPVTGSGFTPGYGSLMNGNFSTLPMPSPNTAAFLNMVTNSTPLGEGGEGEQGNQSGHHDGHQHPPSAIPPHLQYHGLSHMQGHGVQQETITPNTLSALTGVFNDMNRANANAPHPPQVPYFSHGMNPHGPPQGPHVDYAQQSANAASQAANGLFLLSQAHHELSKREEAEGRQTTPLLAKKTSIGSMPPNSGGFNGNKSLNGSGQKRKSDASMGMGGKLPSAKKGKKGLGGTPTPDKMAKMESASPSFSMGTDDDEGDLKELGDNKNETEEEKRKNFLERNRQAALKCRQRKKAWLNELQTKVEQLTMENERLQQTVQGLHDEVGRLSSILMQHRDCGLGIPTNYGRPIR